MRFRIPDLLVSMFPVGGGVLALAFCMAVTACNQAQSPAQQMATLHNQDVEQKFDAAMDATQYRGTAVLVATAPDGTKLWGTCPPGCSHNVYFSSKGTEQTVPDGKGTRIVITPGVSQ